MPQAVAAATELVGAQRAAWMAIDSPAAIVAGRPCASRRRSSPSAVADDRGHVTDASSGNIPVNAMVNVLHAHCEYDADDPDGYGSGVAHVGRQAGGTANTVKLFETPPGQAVCPYHYEYEEEWLLVLAGEPTLRAPDGEHALRPGDLVCFPVGPAGAHKVINRGTGVTRILMWSSSREPAVAVYPDSDKIGVWPGSDADTVLLRRADGAREYYDGEP